MEQITTSQDMFSEVKDVEEMNERSVVVVPEPDGILKVIGSTNSPHYAEGKEIEAQVDDSSDSLESHLERMILKEDSSIHSNDILVPCEITEGYKSDKTAFSLKESHFCKRQNVSAFQPKDRGDGLENCPNEMVPPRAFSTQSSKVTTPDDKTEVSEADRAPLSPNKNHFPNKSQDISALLHPRGGGDSPSFFIFPKRIQKTSSSLRKKTLNHTIVSQKANNEEDNINSTDCPDSSAAAGKDNYESKTVQDWSIETEDYRFLNNFDLMTESSGINSNEAGLNKEIFPYFDNEESNGTETKKQCNYPRIRYTKNYLLQYANCALAYPLPDSLWPFARTQELPLRQCDCSQQTPRYLSGVVPWNLYPSMHHLAFYKTVQFDIDTRRRATKPPY